MTVDIVIEPVEITFTNIRPIIFKLELVAKGSYQEIEWYKNQIDKIGERYEIK